jgi:hypothetical protein
VGGDVGVLIILLIACGCPQVPVVREIGGPALVLCQGGLTSPTEQRKAASFKGAAVWLPSPVTMSLFGHLAVEDIASSIGSVGDAYDTQSTMGSWMAGREPDPSYDWRSVLTA